MMKEKAYSELYRRIESILEGETDPIANMANTASLIHEAFGFWWTGFYIVRGNQLVLGPFQDPVACSSLSRSEIVVPISSPDGDVKGVLDIDSKELSTFDETDRLWLEKIAGLYLLKTTSSSPQGI